MTLGFVQDKSVPKKSWRKIAMSSDGKYQTIVSSAPGSCLILISNDYGKKWSKANINSLSFYDVVMSHDGKYQYAVEVSRESSKVWKSSDYGVNWSHVKDGLITGSWPQGAPLCITTDALGRNVVVGRYYALGENKISYIYSRDYGVTWSNSETLVSYLEVFWCIDMSSDGSVVWAPDQSQFVVNKLWKSTNQGQTRTLVELPNNNNRLMSVAVSGDGQYVTVGTFRGCIYTSSDYGANWIKKDEIGTAIWSDIDMTDDGRTQVAVQEDGHLFKSANYGVTWKQDTTMGQTKRIITGIEISDNGKHMGLVVYQGKYWRFEELPANLSITLPNDVNKLTINAGGKTYTLYVPVIQLLDEAKLEKMSKEELQEWLSDPGKARLLTTQIVNKDGSINDSVSDEVIKKNIGLIVILLGLGTWNGSYKTENKKDEFKNRGITYDHLLDQSIIVNI